MEMIYKRGMIWVYVFVCWYLYAFIVCYCDMICYDL